jgi:hypothetical protein
MPHLRHFWSAARHVPLAAAIASAIACGEPAEPSSPWLRIEPALARYAPGDTVTLVVSNIGPVVIGTTACGSIIERWTGAKWIGSGSATPGCGDVAFLIDVGQTRTLSAGALPPSLDSGTYRLRLPDARTAEGALQILPQSQLASAPILVIR